MRSPAWSYLFSIEAALLLRTLESEMLEREMPGDEVVFSNKVWCLLLGRTCLALAL